MILCNLSVLMAERGLKIADVYEKTGISKTTLMALSENKGKGVQFETVDKLCNFLQVTPSDFFVYSPYMFYVSRGIFVSGRNKKQPVIDVIGKKGIKREKFEPFMLLNFRDEDYVTINSDDDDLEKIFNEMPKLLQRQFINDLEEEISNTFKIDKDYEVVIYNTLIDKR